MLRPVRRSHEVSKSKYFNKDLEAKTARSGRNSAACQITDEFLRAVSPVQVKGNSGRRKIDGKHDHWTVTPQVNS